jgi:hypothetical protein
MLGNGGGDVEFKTERLTVEETRGCRRGRCTLEWKGGTWVGGEGGGSHHPSMGQLCS